MSWSIYCSWMTQLYLFPCRSTTKNISVHFYRSMKYSRRKSVWELDYIPFSFCLDLHLKGIITHQGIQFNYGNTEVLKAAQRLSNSLWHCSFSVNKLGKESLGFFSWSMIFKYTWEMKDRCFTNKIYISRVVFAIQVTDKVLHENVFKVYVHMVIFRKVLKN